MRSIFFVVMLAIPAAAQESFRIDEGANANLFYRDTETAAHAVIGVRAATPRILVAFPAGDSGVGLWFQASSGTAADLLRAPGALRRASGAKPAEVAFDVEAATIELRSYPPLLDSVRALRDYQPGARSWRADAVQQSSAAIAAAEPAVRAMFERSGVSAERIAQWLHPAISASSDSARLEWSREAVGSGVPYRLAIAAASGTFVEALPDGGARIWSSSAPLRFAVEAGVGYPPLTALAPGALLDEQGRACAAKGDPRLAESARNLAFLADREKYLAGSWQYLTYFGRDTLITARALGPLLEPAALEAALGSVLDRLSDEGAVAHEEDIGDQASLRRLQTLTLGLRAGEGVDVLATELHPIDRPIYDYKMIDGEFLLPLAAAEYAARVDPSALRAFLERGSARGETYGAALLRAAERAIVLAHPYADARTGGEFGWELARKLVSLRPGVPVGDWRDSLEGLGGGRYPSSVNVGLVAGAVRAYASVLRVAASAGYAPARTALDGYGGADGLERLASTWDLAHEHFRVSVSVDEARARLRKYLDSFPPEERSALEAVALSSGTVHDFVSGAIVPPELASGLTFWALSLDGDGRPIPVESSDVAFALAEGKLSAAEQAEAAAVLALPFPVGLASPVGTLVANPAFSPRDGDYSRFGRDRYHGTVVWSWPLELERVALKRRLRDAAPDGPARPVLERALAAAEAGERNVGALRASELWTWRVSSGTIVPTAFGAGATDETEANALQLWSTLNLGAECAVP